MTDLLTDQPEDNASPQIPPPRGGVARIASRIAAVNGLFIFLSLLTGPLQARALGTSGRGELAAVTSSVTLATLVASFGLYTYVTWATARGRHLGQVTGSVAVIFVGIGGFFAIAALPLAHLISGGHGEVERFVAIGLGLIVFTLLGDLAISAAVGLEEWTAFMASRLASALITTAPIVVLYAVGSLTVATASICFLCSALASVFCIVVVARRREKPVYRRSVAREALGYGSRAWLAGVSSAANGRLDQVVMISLVSAHELGLYAVAVNLATFFISPVIGAMQTTIVPRVSKGQRELASSAARLALAGSLLCAGFVAVISPFALPLLFGSAYSAALPAVLILVVAAVPQSLKMVLSSTVQGEGEPGIAARAEIIGLTITVPGLLIVLPLLGEVGAALVSLATYTAVAAYLVVRARGIFGGTLRDFAKPGRAEFRWMLQFVTARIRGLLTRTRRQTRRPREKPVPENP